MTNRSRSDQVLAAIRAHPGEKAGFYQKKVGFDPGYQLLSLYRKEKVQRVGKQRNYRYSAAAAANGAANDAQAPVPSKKPPRKQQQQRRGPSRGEVVEIPLEAIGSFPHAMLHSAVPDDAALLGALIVGVFTALKGKQP